MVTPRFPPYIGGAETHVFETSRRLVRLGVRVTVVSTIVDPADLGTLAERESIDGVELVRIPAVPAMRDLHVAPRLVEVIRSRPWDLVHCQGVHTAIPTLSMLTCLYDTTPYVVTFHSGGHSSSLRNRLRGWQWKVQGPLLRRAGKLISVSEFEASYFEKVLNLPNGSCPVVANGVEGDADVSHEVPQVIPGLIVSPGRLERYKGHHRVIEALSIVRNSVQDARLLILGSGSYEGELRAVIQREGLDECVEIRSIPAIARSQMRHTLGSANVVVILSDYESQGIAAGEALLAGRPLIVTASSALKELSDQGLAVGLPRDASPELLARQIIEVMQRVHVPATPPLPSWDVCAEALLGIYDRVLTQRRS